MRAARLALVGTAVALAVVSPAAAAAPGATTGPVSAVGGTSATVSGSVAPNGASTTWYFDYGASTAYGSRTATSSAGSGTSPVDVSAALADLAPATTYHYRVVAAGAGGTTRGADGLFTTLSPPRAATGGASAGSGGATLSGTVDPRGRATTWYFEYGSTTGYGSRTGFKSAGSGTSDVDVSATVSGLSAGATYHYRLVAASDAGTVRGADEAFTAAGRPIVATGGASAIGPTSADLSGSVDPAGAGTTWYFDLGTTTGYGTRTPTRTLAAGAGTAALRAGVSALRAGTSYHYRLVARNAAGETRGADATFATPGAPGARTGGATGVGGSGATVTGSVDPQGRSTSWWFEYGTGTGYGSRTPTRSVGSAAGDHNVSTTLAGLHTGARYHYRLVAASDAGTTRGADASFVTAPLPVLVTGAASAVGPTSATLAGTVDPRGLATTWSFEYGTTTRYGGHTPSRSASRAGPVSAVAGGLKPSTTYHYRLVATSAAGTSRGADQRLATPAAVRAGVATGPPSGISTTAATLGGTVNANGVPATWSVEYGSTAAYGSRTPSVVVAGTQQVSVRVTGLAPGTLYHYRLVVVNAAGTTTGADAQATTAAAPRTPGGDLVRCTIVGTTGNDVLHGTGHKDVICGLDGNDTIVGDGGSDVIYAGNGNDRVFGGLGNDVVFAGPGNDLAKGGTGRDTLDGGTGNDALYGDAGNDVVLGRAGSDVVAGGVNRDRLLGGPGDDVFIAADGFRDLVDGGAGDDRGSVDRGRDLARSISPA